MARFVLQPCAIREARFVPKRKEEPIEFDWPALRARLAPSSSGPAQANLCRLEPLMFVGLIRTRHGPANFIYQDGGRRGFAGVLLRKDPTFLDRIVEVFRVVEVEYGGRCVEQG